MAVTFENPPKADRLVHRLIRQIVFALVHLYYPRLEVHGAEKIPEGKPVIFVPNHPNGLLDPILIMLTMKRSVSFLAKGTLFGNPVGRLFLGAFAALPIFRLRDSGQSGGPVDEEDMRAKNESIFSVCRQILHQNGAMAIFPEGKTHSESYLSEFKTGAARIALSAEAESGWTDDLQIVPVGLWYEDKTMFRSSVLVVIGDPYDIRSYRESYEADAYQTAHDMTAKLKKDLDEVVLQAENNDLLAAIPAVARWVEPQFDEMPLIDQHELTSEMIDAYSFIQTDQPEQLQSFSDDARKYARALHTLGIDDPWELEIPAATKGRPWRLLTFLIVSFPFAVIGALVSYFPYRMAKPVAIKVMGDDTSTISTVKLILGALFVLIGYILLACLVGSWFNSGWIGLFAFGIFPTLGYLALIWGEGFEEWSTLTSYHWLRLARTDLVDALKKQREFLAIQVRDALEDYRNSSKPAVGNS
ncbi:MAG: lysophospholipid acyltransferase family protein [Anaerolineae bacterium]